MINLNRTLNSVFALVALLAAGMCGAQQSTPQSKSQIVMASTTSTEQSGLFSHLLPEFTRDTGIVIKVVAVGTGQALDIARRGDADVVFVHDRAAELEFVQAGWGVNRRDVMHNDFVLIGDKSDPAQVRGDGIAQALQKIAKSNAPFFSRGDNSGTHAAELRYWRMAGGNQKGRVGKGNQYKECGCGMGQALNMAAAAGTYVLSDRGTWLNFKNPQSLEVLVQGDPQLFNAYGVMAVNPAKHPHVKYEAAMRFVDWVTSKRGQAVINNYKINGQQLFFGDAP